MLNSGYVAQYGANLTALIARLRADLGAPDLAWYVGAVSHKGIWGIHFRGNMQLLQQQQQAVAAAAPRVHFVPGSHLAFAMNGTQPHYHYGTEGTLQLGDAFAAAHLTAVGLQTPHASPAFCCGFPATTSGETVRVFIVAGQRTAEGEGAHVQEIGGHAELAALANPQENMLFRYRLGGGLHTSTDWASVGFLGAGTPRADGRRTVRMWLPPIGSEVEMSMDRTFYVLLALSPLLAGRAPAQEAWVPLQPTEFHDSGRLFLDPVSRRLSTFGGGYPSSADQGAYAGDVWVRRTPAVVPPARRGHLLAGDPARERTLLFGGFDTLGGAYLGDTWQWDGRQWLASDPAIAPSPRANPGYAYDPRRQRVVLFGGEDARGALGDTWEWDGTAWTQRAATGAPIAVTGAAMGFDPVRGTVLLFGGDRDPVRGFAFSDQFWEWDGVRWQQVDATQRPRARSLASLAHDPVAGQMVLVGGVGCTRCGVNPTDDTWAYRGGTWTRVSRTSGPEHNGVLYDPARAQLVGINDGGLFGWGANRWRSIAKPTGYYPFGISLGAMVFDEANDVLMRYGGSVFDGRFAGTATASMALWDGAAWTGLPYGTAASGGPGERGLHAMAYDSTRGRVVMFGGQGDWAAMFDDTWEWDGAAMRWHRITTAQSPSPGAHTMTYDGARDRIVLLEKAVATSTPVRKTWEYDGVNWTPTALSSSPTQDGAITYDPSRARTVAFTHGGAGAETWEYDGIAWSPRSPTRSPAATGPMTYDQRLGRVLLIEDGSSATWAWDGSDWQPLAAGFAPTPARGGAMVAHHASSGRTVLYGGYGTEFYLSWLDDTWLLGATPSARTLGAGCGRGTWIDAFGAPVRGSRVFAVDFGGLARSAPAALMLGAAARTLPLSGGCALELDPAAWAVTLPALTSPLGFVSLPLPISMRASLAGQTVVLQGVGPDTTSGFGGLDLTPGLAVQVGG